MGLFGNEKQKETTLAENEFKFNLSFFKYIVNNNSFTVQLLNKKGNMTSEETFSFKQIEKIEHKSVGGNRYRIGIKLANEKKADSIRTIDYNRKDESYKADKLIALMNDRIS